MILVKFEKTIQVNEDEWRNVWIEKVFEEHKSLKAVIEWAKEEQSEDDDDDVENYKLDVRGLIITEI